MFESEILCPCMAVDLSPTGSTCQEISNGFFKFSRKSGEKMVRYLVFFGRLDRYYLVKKIVKTISNKTINLNPAQRLRDSEVSRFRGS